MAKNLVIVESPAKAKTLSKFLGKDFQIESCFGHIADLPPRGLGINVDKDFAPNYVILEDKKKVVKNLDSFVKKSDTVWLASDEDREGEAIAWHLKEQLKLSPENTKRIVFHEITKKTILKAIENPRDINYDMVNAQQARRVLDRLVGYELSPVLWKKVKAGLSAGRVQSVAVRLIVEKERSIKEFIKKSYYKVTAEFSTNEGKIFKAAIPKNFEKREEAESFLKNIANTDFSIVDLQKKPTKKSPLPPFTTSTLQQEASHKLGFSVTKTMIIAQQLYESGLITYMRTDSVNLSDEAKKEAKEEIINNYGIKYSNPRNFKNKSKGAQEAHEAIRPTYIKNHSTNVEYDQNRLYSLIWKRTVASQMSDAQLEHTNVKISNSANDKIFTANGEVIKFEGFLKIYLEINDNEKEDTGILPDLKIGTPLTYKVIKATQRFTKAPFRFGEASLVKKLEELGIGRPSTYAPTISTIQKRGYIEKGQRDGIEVDYEQFILKNKTVSTLSLSEKLGSDKGKLIPTDIGNIVNDFLVANFSKILDFGFTAKIETDFDDISRGEQNWVSMIKEFYKNFHPRVKDVSENAERESGERVLGKHPETGRTVLVRLGKFGPIAQIGDPDDEKKLFASLLKEQNLETITLEEALDLFLLPKKLGDYKNKEVIVSNGRFGPFIKFEKLYVSLPKEEDPMKIDLEKATELILEKQKSELPIAEYENLPVQKGIGRFGPFIKWNGIFINISKKYDYDNLTYENIVELIEDKKQKEKEKIIHNWEKEGIRIEKARWGTFNIVKDKTKINLPKTTNVKNMNIDEAKSILEKNVSKKKKNRNQKSIKK